MAFFSKLVLLKTLEIRLKDVEGLEPEGGFGQFLPAKILDAA